jgi:acetamidase/formamidase
VVTSTLDAGGFDSAGVKRGERPNPETGPFYIDGAEPGDTLVVHLLRLETNKATGFSASLLAPYTADPAFLRAEALREAKQATWHIDKQKGIAYSDPADYKGPRIELPLRPMLGCIGTAPDNHAAIPSSTAETFGGNMDYNGMGAGATVMLPVFEPGALFFLGDGHARQGDGEVDQTALETSLVGEFRFVVRKDMKLDWPRAETPTHWIAMGLDEDLNKAVRLATEEAVSFLMEKNHLSRADAYMLVSVAVDLHITQLVDQVKGVHAMIPKAILGK